MGAAALFANTAAPPPITKSTENLSCCVLRTPILQIHSQSQFKVPYNTKIEE